MAYISEHIRVENARITSRNFSGKEELPYNPAGKRNFSVVFDKEMGYNLWLDGWKIKGRDFEAYATAKHNGAPVDEDAEAPGYLNVAVAFGNKPPKIVMISNGRPQELNEQTVSILDDANIESVDLDISPYNWTLPTGASGVKAYLNTMYVVLKPDAFYDKYAKYYEAPAMPESGSSDSDNFGLPFEI